jgi:hypothetical protein
MCDLYHDILHQMTSLNQVSYESNSKTRKLQIIMEVVNNESYALSKSMVQDFF